MKATTIILAVFISTSVYSQTFIPNDWERNQPQDTATHIFGRGISSPKDNEREAVLEAGNTAVLELSQRILMLVDSRYISIIERYGSEPKENAIEIERNSIFTRLVLPNVNRVYKTERRDGKFIAYSLAYISRNDADRALMSAENELSSFSAYNYFASRVSGLRPFSITQSPDGFNDYHSWVVANAGILSTRGNNQDLLNQLETFVRVLLPDTISFSARYNGEPVRFIYGIETLDIISRTLQRHGIPFSWEHPRLIVSGSERLDNLVRMNPSMVYVAGTERIHHSYNNQRFDERGIMARELIRRIQNVSRKNTALFTLPARSTGFSETEVIELIRRRNDLPSRYVIVYFAETFVEPARVEFRTPPFLFVECRVLVYDQILGSIIFSETLKNGIPINGENDLTGSYEILISRLLNTAFAEALSKSMEVRHVR